MRILLLGGTGFLASYLLPCLNELGTVHYTYANNPIEGGIRYRIGKDNLSVILENNYQIVVNNINPTNLTFEEVVSFSRELGMFSAQSSSRLIHISSLSASQENRFNNSYNFKKGISEDILVYFNKDRLTVLRFPQLFDSAGKAKKSQAGLYYFLESVKHLKRIDLAANSSDCVRNYLHVELAVKIILYFIHNDKKETVIEAYFESYTFSIDEILRKIMRFNNFYNPSELINVTEKAAATYVIGTPNEELNSNLCPLRSIEFYLNEAYQQI